MNKKVISIIMVASLAALALSGCTEKTGEAEVTYKVVGGISEPTRVWNEVTTDDVKAEAPEEETVEEYFPDVLPMDPLTFVTNKTANTLTSDKDGEVIETLDEGTEIVLVGTTGKGYYATEDGAFISASDVEKVVSEESKEEQVAETKPQTTTTTQTPTTTTETPAPAQESQPAPEQTYEEPQQQVAEQPAQEAQPAQSENFYDADDFDYEAWYAQAEAERLAEQEQQATCDHSYGTREESGINLGTGEIETHYYCVNCGECLY